MNIDNHWLYGSDNDDTKRFENPEPYKYCDICYKDFNIEDLKVHEIGNNEHLDVCEDCLKILVEEDKFN